MCGSHRPHLSFSKNLLRLALELFESPEDILGADELASAAVGVAPLPDCLIVPVVDLPSLKEDGNGWVIPDPKVEGMWKYPERKSFPTSGPRVVVLDRSLSKEDSMTGGTLLSEIVDAVDVDGVDIYDAPEETLDPAIS